MFRKHRRKSRWPATGEPSPTPNALPSISQRQDQGMAKTERLDERFPLDHVAHSPFRRILNVSGCPILIDVRFRVFGISKNRANIVFSGAIGGSYHDYY